MYSDPNKIICGPIIEGPIYRSPFPRMELPGEQFPQSTPIPPKVSKPTAASIVEQAAKQMVARGVLRDSPQGERSIATTVAAFNTLTGKNLTEQEGWEFMILLKMVRGRQGKFNEDDYVDGAAYFALLGESEATRGR